MDLPKNASVQNFAEKNHGLTVKEYSRFFRILYNSSYLSQSNSEKALKTLSQTKFTEGIRKNMPKDIVVASKFGEIGIDEQIKQIHECGIVYYPNHPYLICIMTRGPNPKYLTKSISEISDFVFSEVKKQYTKVSPDQVR